MERVIVSGFFGRTGFAFPAAEVAAAAEATAAIAASDHAAEYNQRLKKVIRFLINLLNKNIYLAPSRGDQEIGIDVLLAKLFSNVQPERSIIVINIPFG